MPVPSDYKFDLPFENGEGLNDVFRDIPKAPNLPDVDDEYKKLNCYNKNEMLMAKGTKFPYTPEHAAEWRRCRDDVFYFLINYATINTIDKGTIKFQLYQYQKNMIHVMNSTRNSIFLLPRQMGKCVQAETYITIRNKTTGDIEQIEICKFHEMIKNINKLE